MLSPDWKDSLFLWFFIFTGWLYSKEDVYLQCCRFSGTLTKLPQNKSPLGRCQCLLKQSGLKEVLLKDANISLPLDLADKRLKDSWWSQSIHQCTLESIQPPKETYIYIYIRRLHTFKSCCSCHVSLKYQHPMVLFLPSELPGAEVDVLPGHSRSNRSDLSLILEMRST